MFFFLVVQNQKRLQSYLGLRGHQRFQLDCCSLLQWNHVNIDLNESESAAEIRVPSSLDRTRETSLVAAILHKQRAVRISDFEVQEPLDLRKLALAEPGETTLRWFRTQLVAHNCLAECSTFA